MAFKVTANNTELNQQIEVLKYYPELFKKHVRPRMKMIVADLANAIKPNIPRATGKAAQTFGSRVIGTGINIEGQVGWYDYEDPWYINIVEYGSRPHPIASGSKSRTRSQRERFNQSDVGSTDKGGTHIYVKGAWKTKTVVSGFSGRAFMSSAFNARREAIYQSMQEATRLVLADLEVQ